jgi:hypothetical protein
VRVVSVKTTMQCLDLERRKERIREKRRGKKIVTVDYCKQDNANPGQACSE